MPHCGSLFSSRYPPCIIAMAHRVVAQWFVRCRIQYRPAMARFISKVHITSSHLHIITSPHPHTLTPPYHHLHISPSHLHTITYPHPHTITSHPHPHTSTPSPIHILIPSSICAHFAPSQKLSVYAGSISVGREGEGGEEVGEELVEVCEDMMARFTYSNLSTLPSR